MKRVAVAPFELKLGPNESYGRAASVKPPPGAKKTRIRAKIRVKLQGSAAWAQPLKSAAPRSSEVTPACRISIQSLLSFSSTGPAPAADPPNSGPPTPSKCLKNRPQNSTQKSMPTNTPKGPNRLPKGTPNGAQITPKQLFCTKTRDLDFCCYL